MANVQSVLNVAKPQRANSSSFVTEDDFKEPTTSDGSIFFSKSGSSIGIVIGVIFGILALGGLGYVFYRQWKKKIQLGSQPQNIDLEGNVEVKNNTGSDKPNINIQEPIEKSGE